MIDRLVLRAKFNSVRYLTTEFIITEEGPKISRSVFIFKSGIGSVQLQQWDSVFFKTVENLAGRMLMDCTCHATADWSAKGMPTLTLGPDGEGEISLMNVDFISGNFERFCTQIGSKAVLSSTQKHDPDHAGEMKTAQRNICNREHQRTVRETALCPDIFPGKGISPVTFNVANGIPKHIGYAVNENSPIYRVPHTEHTVSALHEWNISERPHDVVLDWCKRAKSNRASGMETGGVDVQRDAIPLKPIPSNVNCVILFQK